MKASVIISTYNAPDHLEKVLWGYTRQMDRPLEIIIADDGSTDETHRLIERFRSETSLPLRHLWHADEGFRKSMILNRAIREARAGYLIFTDGDCIPRNDFVAAHTAHAEPGRFLSGGVLRLSKEATESLTREHIVSGRFANAQWLRARGLQRPHRKMLKLTTRGWPARLLNLLTPTNATFNGGNASVWREDVLRVNGFDERMQYGGQDRELGERLVNAGVRPKQIRYSAALAHLHHDRPYRTGESLDRNREIRRRTREEKRTWTEYGIERGQ